MPKKKRQKSCAKPKAQPEQKASQAECSKGPAAQKPAQPECSTEKKEVEEQQKV